jgi:hypothetical protein
LLVKGGNAMAIVKLKAGETVLVAAVDPALHPDQGLPKPEAPVDPGYGIDLGLGIWGPTDPRPTNPIVLPPPVEVTPPPVDPVDPGYGIDVDAGYTRPTHPIVLPPPAPGKPAIEWKLVTAWTPVTGWIVVAVPTGNVPTPSRK